LLVGLIVGRRVIGVPTLVAAQADELVSIIGPAIQKILVPEEERCAEQPAEAASGGRQGR
jgi:hypothetical protein